jgi:membrane protease subunit (stomatin/prohibitin family)
MFGRKKKEKLASWQTEPVKSTVQVTVDGLGTPGEHIDVNGEPLAANPTDLASSAKPANTGDPTTFTTRTVIDGGTTVIDARGVPGLRAELLKALGDVRAGGNPAELQAAVLKAMSQGMTLAGQQAALSDATPAPPAEDPLDRLEKLNELRQSGALTDAEFEAQKKKLLGEL